MAKGKRETKKKKKVSRLGEESRDETKRPFYVGFFDWIGSFCLFKKVGNKHEINRQQIGFLFLFVACTVLE